MRALLILLTLSLITQAAAANEGEAVATDLAELRGQYQAEGKSVLQASPEEFAQAVESIRDTRRPEAANQTRRDAFVPTDRDAVRRRDAFPKPEPQQHPPHQRPWGQPDHDRNRFHPPQPAPHPGAPYPPIRPSAPHRAPVDPTVRLREAAHHLDRIAHELEMAELFQAADSVRQTAQKLRQEARPQAGT